MKTMLFPHRSATYGVKRSNKLCHVIDALKKGIELGTIEKIENPGAKTLYKDHYYRAVLPLAAQ